MPSLLRKKYPGFVSLLLCLLALQQLQGCAMKPWHAAISEQQQEMMIPLTNTLLQEQALCGACLDGNMKISIKSSLGERAIRGYFRLMQPEKMKFIADNPLGQPIFAASGDDKTFHYLNTIERIVLTGTTESLFHELGLPLIFSSASWPQWLMAQIPVNTPIINMRVDRKQRGIWLTYQNGRPGIQEHLLLDSNKERILSRIVTDGHKTVLQLDYEKMVTISGCSIPGKIRISNYDFSTETVLELMDVEYPDSCDEEDFFLPTPSGYSVRKF